jgi:hypothetical protein
MPPQQPNLASNPFFNMGAAAVGNTAAATIGFPAITQVCYAEHIYNVRLMILGIQTDFFQSAVQDRSCKESLSPIY